MVPNINANPRGRKITKRGRKPIFNAAIFKERFNTIERVFGWEDKFRRLLLRFERLSQLHYAFKTLAYTMINPPLLPGLIAQPMPFHDGRTTAEFRTPIQPKTWLRLRKIFLQITAITPHCLDLTFLINSARPIDGKTRNQ